MTLASLYSNQPFLRCWQTFGCSTFHFAAGQPWVQDCKWIETERGSLEVLYIHEEREIQGRTDSGRFEGGQD
jgi:hypothetical protein